MTVRRTHLTPPMLSSLNLALRANAGRWGHRANVALAVSTVRPVPLVRMVSPVLMVHPVAAALTVLMAQQAVRGQPVRAVWMGHRDHPVLTVLTGHPARTA